MSIVRRWTDRLNTRLRLLRRARARHDSALVKRRKDQVDYARRVIARHSVSKVLRERALDQASERLAAHVFETGGNNRGPAVEQIIHYAGGDTGEPWCVDFVIWCYGHARSTVVKPGWFRAVRLMLSNGTRSSQTGRPGDAVRYKFDHTGIFVRYANAAGAKVERDRATHIVAIEGNTGWSVSALSDGNGHDGIYRKVRPLADVQDFIQVLR